MREWERLRVPGAWAVASALFLVSTDGWAQASQWDAALSNSYWYVPTEGLLGYAVPSNDFSSPIPLGDQTLWSLGPSVNGTFAGTSAATLALGPVTTSDVSTIAGNVTAAGTITMVFTPQSGGAPTIGLGEMTLHDGQLAMEMQMITGTELLVTHWAPMLPYDPASFTPPVARTIPVTLASSEWQWAESTRWKIANPALFGTAQPGTLVVTNYTNGYFWGRAIRPDGAGEFTLIGSITPDGKVLLATTDGTQVATQYGDITGDATAAAMQLEDYDYVTGVFPGTFSDLFLVSPYQDAMAANGNPAAENAATELYRQAATVEGLTGVMAPVFARLDAMNGRDLSFAVGETLPILSASAAEASYDTHRAFQQTMDQRIWTLLDGDPGQTSGGDRYVWMTPYGGFTDQDDKDSYSGYSSQGGGLAAGFDADITGRFRLGATGGIASYAISDDRDNELNLTSYALGLYSLYSLAPGWSVDGRIDGAFNRNSESRDISFMASTARGTYDSFAGHAGIGLNANLPAHPDGVLSSALRLDYGRLTSESYGETGAGPLSLDVDRQTYEELRLSGLIRGRHSMSGNLALAGHAGISYDLLNERQKLNAAYSGGGGVFATEGPDTSPWLFSAGLGLVRTETGGMEAGLHYDIDASPSGYLSQKFSFAIKGRF